MLIYVTCVGILVNANRWISLANKVLKRQLRTCELGNHAVSGVSGNRGSLTKAAIIHNEKEQTVLTGLRDDHGQLTTLVGSSGSLHIYRTKTYQSDHRF